MVAKIFSNFFIIFFNILSSNSSLLKFISSLCLIIICFILFTSFCGSGASGATADADDGAAADAADAAAAVGAVSADVFSLIFFKIDVIYSISSPKAAISLSIVSFCSLNLKLIFCLSVIMA